MEGELLYIRPFGSNGEREEKKKTGHRNPWDWFLYYLPTVPTWMVDLFFVGCSFFSKWAMKKGALFRVGDDKLPSYTGMIS